MAVDHQAHATASSYKAIASQNNKVSYVVATSLIVSLFNCLVHLLVGQVTFSQPAAQVYTSIHTKLTQKKPWLWFPFLFPQPLPR